MSRFALKSPRGLWTIAPSRSHRMLRVRVSAVHASVLALSDYARSRPRWRRADDVPAGQTWLRGRRAPVAMDRGVIR